MTIQINNEIQNIKENYYFGLNLREIIFTAIAVILSVVIYYVLHMQLQVNTDTTTFCIVVATIPFAFMGFGSINGLKPEEYIKAWFIKYILAPQILHYHQENFIMQLYQEKAPAEKNKKSRSNLYKKFVQVLLRH